MKYCATGLNRELRSVQTYTQLGTGSKDHFTHAYFSTYADIVALDLWSVIGRQIRYVLSVSSGASSASDLTLLGFLHHKNFVIIIIIILVIIIITFIHHEGRHTIRKVDSS